MDQQNGKIAFGIDAPFGIMQLLAQGLLYVLFAWPLYWWTYSYSPLWALVGFWALIFSGSISLLFGVLMVLSSLYGKPLVIQQLVKQLQLNGSEQVLDLGCGTGILLIEVAQSLPRGYVVGLDIWQTKDQRPNSYTTTLLNANRAGVEQRIDLKTGDMRNIPFPDQHFDLVVSSLAIHNVPSEEDRKQVFKEIVRVLKSGGRFSLLDFQYTDQYVEELNALGCQHVERSPLNFLMFPPVRIVTGMK